MLLAGSESDAHFLLLSTQREDCLGEGNSVLVTYMKQALQRLNDGANTTLGQCRVRQEQHHLLSNAIEKRAESQKAEP